MRPTKSPFDLNGVCGEEARKGIVVECDCSG